MRKWELQKMIAKGMGIGEWAGKRNGSDGAWTGKGRKVYDQNISDKVRFFFFSHLHSKAFSWMFISDLKSWWKESSGKSFSLPSLQLVESKSLIIGHVRDLLNEIDSCGYYTRLAKNQHAVAVKAHFLIAALASGYNKNTLLLFEIKSKCSGKNIELESGKAGILVPNQLPSACGLGAKYFIWPQCPYP